ncbi:MAG TPA: non-ribosomal peptide synthetase, partial [Thioploca sp.]|nr:non-ribosomal peptide synthetase [Thioploca sp.]
LNLSEGPLLRVALFQLGNEQPNRLLFVIHHIVIDGVSWRILLEDVTTAYQHLSRGEAIKLPPKTTSFKQWAQRVTEYAQSEALAAELDYWLIESRLNVAPLPVDFPSNTQANTVASSAEVSVSLSVEQTGALLTEVPQAYQTQINDVLLTALVQSFARWTGEPTLLIGLEGHGREEIFEDIDISRTLGWFTSEFPVLLDIGAVSNREGEALKSVKEQLRKIPNWGIGYGLLRYVNPETAQRLQALPQAEVSFNYLGQVDQMADRSSPSEKLISGLAQESMGAEQSPLNHRDYLLDVTGMIVEGKLTFDWIYSKNIHNAATIEPVAHSFIEALKALIVHCRSLDVQVYTPSDFPEIDFNQDELDELLDDLDED